MPSPLEIIAAPCWCRVKIPKFLSWGKNRSLWSWSLFRHGFATFLSSRHPWLLPCADLPMHRKENSSGSPSPAPDLCLPCLALLPPSLAVTDTLIYFNFFVQLSIQWVRSTVLSKDISKIMKKKLKPNWKYNPCESTGFWCLLQCWSWIDDRVVMLSDFSVHSTPAVSGLHPSIII